MVSRFEPVCCCRRCALKERVNFGHNLQRIRRNLEKFVVVE